MLNGVTGHLRRRGLPAVQPNRRGCEEQVPTWLLPHQGGAELLLFTGHLLCARQWVCALLITRSRLPQARASAGCPGLCTRPVLRLSWCSVNSPHEQPRGLHCVLSPLGHGGSERKVTHPRCTAASGRAAASFPPSLRPRRAPSGTGRHGQWGKPSFCHFHAGAGDTHLCYPTRGEPPPQPRGAPRVTARRG